MDNKIYELLVDRGAIMEGHFVLTSGLHSNKYVEKFRILENPESLAVMCKAMADKYRNAHIDIVVSAAIGGILISSGVAKELGVKGIFCERVNGKMLFKRGFSIPEGSNVLVVEDIVTTGGSIKEILQILDTLNVNLVSVCTLAHRGDPIEFGCGYDTLVNIDIETWRESEIPDWLDQIPITKPGSTGK
jgi:orotate phosphoribosyltransferase